MRALPVAVALIALTSVVAGAAVGPASTADSRGTAAVAPDGSGVPAVAAESNESIGVLALQPNQPNRTDIHRESVSLGPGVELASRETSYRLSSYAATERIESIEDPTDRQRRILNELNAIEQRSIGLKNEQRRIAAAYTRGAVGARELLIALARLDSEARSLERRRDQIAELAKETPDFSVDSGRLDALERDLETYTGPVRRHAAAVLRGRAPATRFYVSTTPDGVVLSTIVDDEYVRESYRGDLRDLSGPRLSPEEALNVTERAYPGVWDSRRDTEVVGSGQSYAVRITYGRGELSAFVASGSRKVFKAFQRRPLSTMESAAAVTDRRDGLELTVNRSYPGGPMRIRLTGARSDDPVDANVTVGLEGSESTLVGRTGGNGELWTLTPGDRFTVTAIRGNSVVFVTIDPAATPHVYAPPSNRTATPSTT